MTARYRSRAWRNGMTRIFSQWCRQSCQSLQTLLRSSLGLLLLLAAACGVLTPEEQLLQRFFEASRLYDAVAARKVATVVFHPITDGIVQDFAITKVDGDGSSRTVTVAAQVRRGSGTATAETLVVTLERRDGWIITGIRREAAR